MNIHLRLAKISPMLSIKSLLRFILVFYTVFFRTNFVVIFSANVGPSTCFLQEVSHLIKIYVFYTLEWYNIGHKIGVTRPNTTPKLAYNCDNVFWLWDVWFKGHKKRNRLLSLCVIMCTIMPFEVSCCCISCTLVYFPQKLIDKWLGEAWILARKKWIIKSNISMT